MKGIVSCAGYIPYRRLDLTTVAAVAGNGGRKGKRAVASFDEDATTMAVEASRAALASAPAGFGVPDSLWYATANPPYLDRTNANTIHAALRLRRTAGAYDALGSVRSGMGALRAALAQPEPALVAAGDVRLGPAGGPDEAYFGDGGAALVIGDDSEGPLLAELIASASVADEFIDRWRTPGDTRSKVWEERFGEIRYTTCGTDAFDAALKAGGIDAGQVDRLLVTGTHGRAVRTVTERLGATPDPVMDQLATNVGNTGAAHPHLLLTAALERAVPDQIVALVVLADGADVFLLRTTGALITHRARRPVATQIESGGPIAYGRYLAWRGMLPVEPPRRPEPARVSASAAGRSVPWKYGFVGSRSEEGTVSLPPEPADPETVAMADAVGTVRTFTIDRLSYTPNPPMVFAVVDFDGGGRLPMELTDIDAADVAVGDRVEMTFRRLSTGDGLHNYFWKARPLRGGER